MSANSKNTFVRSSSATDSTDVPIQQAETDFELGSPPPTTAIEVEVAAVPSKETFELEAFMAEMLEVIFPEPGDDNEPQFFECKVNGDGVCIPRNGEAHRMRRYHVAVAAQAKTGKVRQKKLVNADGSMGYQEQTVMAQSYPFMVQHDPNPRGPAWLKSLLKSPA